MLNAKNRQAEDIRDGNHPSYVDSREHKTARGLTNQLPKLDVMPSYFMKARQISAIPAQATSVDRSLILRSTFVEGLAAFFERWDTSSWTAPGLIFGSFAFFRGRFDRRFVLAAGPVWRDQ